jgi:hypothetical protein
MRRAEARLGTAVACLVARCGSQTRRALARRREPTRQPRCGHQLRSLWKFGEGDWSEGEGAAGLQGMRRSTAADGHDLLGRSLASARGLAERSLTPPRAHTPTAMRPSASLALEIWGGRLERGRRCGGAAGDEKVNGRGRPWAPRLLASARGLAERSLTPPRAHTPTAMWPSASLALEIWRGRFERGRGTAALSVASGDGQSSYVDQLPALPLAARLVDGTGTPLEGFHIAWDVVPLGGALCATDVKTDAKGTATVTARPGLSVGPFRFRASFHDIHGNPIGGSPAAFTLNATVPPAGTSFTAVNTLHKNDLSPPVAGLPCAGTMAANTNIWGTAADSSGNVYLVMNYGEGQIFKLTPSGYPSCIAACTFDCAGQTVATADLRQWLVSIMCGL